MQQSTHLHKVYLGLGSNLGNRKRTIHQAIDRLGELLGTVERQSALYETEPWGYESPNAFINAAVCCATLLEPRQVLEITQQIEREFGRIYKSENGVYQDRILDIDILTYDDIHIDEPDLKIPHPLMHERKFVMKPLNEIMK